MVIESDGIIVYSQMQMKLLTYSLHKFIKKCGNVPYKVYSIGNNHPEKLVDFIALLEEFSGKKL